MLLAQAGRGGTRRGYSIYPWVGRSGSAPHAPTPFKTKIAYFPTLFKTEFRFLIPCLRQKMLKSIPCLRQKSRKTYPGWPHVPIKPLLGSTPRGVGEEENTLFFFLALALACSPIIEKKNKHE